MASQLSLNQIIQYFAKIAANIKRVHTFGYGPLEDIGRDNPPTNSQPIYPLMWVEPVISTLRKDSVILRHRIYILDLLQKDLSNRQDVLSDSFNTCLEIKSFIFKDFFYDIFPSDESQLEPIFYKTDDELEGYVMDLDLQLDWLADVCSIPGLYPSGNTFVAGPGYYNVQSTGYLPLAGGQLTGPLTGTSAYFDNYFSGGTNLSQLFSGGTGGSTYLDPTQIAFGSNSSGITGSTLFTFNELASLLSIFAISGNTRILLNNGFYNTNLFSRLDASDFGNVLGDGAVEFSTASPAGMIIGTIVNTPVVIGSNNNPVLFIQPNEIVRTSQLSATTVSGGTIYSGATNLYSIFQTVGSAISATTINVTSISATTYYSGSTDLSEIIIAISGKNNLFNYYNFS